eukprot:Tamp_03498.p1 GENE.Tamp_03498~~Tamp_03498.p1  ORF type:complete len:677 (-),score=143.32 Tamp_03498:1666-3474(-)
MEEVRSYPDALEKVERLIDDMLLFVQAEARRLPAVVSNPDAILLLLVERLCYERLAPMIEGVLDQAEAAAARDDHLAHDPAPSAAASNDRLECKVKVVRACLRFLASLKDPNRHMGASDGLGVPVADKDAGDDMAGMVADILAPYVHDFVEVQVDTLMERLAAYLPVVAPDDLVVYDLHGRQQAPGPLHRHDRLDRLDRHEADITPIADRDSTGMLPSRLSAAVSSQYADEEGRGAPGEEHAGKQREEHAGGGMQATRAASAASGEARSTSAALAWAARKRRDFSCTLPAPPTVWRWGGAKPAASAANQSKRQVVISVSNIARAVEEAGVAMERVLEVSEIHAAPSLRGQGALGVVATYMQSYNAFLYACISHAAQACGQQLQQRAPQDLDVPRAAFVAVAGAKAQHDMLARSGLTSAGGLHGTGSARLSQMLAQSDAWTEGALDALSKALVEATIQQASATLQALRLKRDYAPTQSHASNGDSVVEPHSTEACRQCVLLVRGVAWSWLEHGPSALHGQALNTNRDHRDHSHASQAAAQEAAAATAQETAAATKLPLGMAGPSGPELSPELSRRTLDVNSTAVSVCLHPFSVGMVTPTFSLV